MGAAARKLAHRAAPARPALRLVRGGRRSRARSNAAVAEIFRVAVVCLLVLGIAGMTRVALAVQATEASIDAYELRKELKAEEKATRTLEADRSTLAAPSRIEVLACETLNMARPIEVCYLELPGATDGPSDSPASPGAPDPAAGPTERLAVSGLLASLMDLAAGEAQVLLVGDMGLGQAR